MVWKFVGETPYATIFVNYTKKKTKVVTFKYTYYHDGIYPYHNPDYHKKFVNGGRK